MLFSSVHVQLLFAVVLVLIFQAFVTGLKRGTPCITPNQENATCRFLRKCSVLLEAALDPTPDTADFLEKSKCGRNTTLVCCGTSGVPNNPSPTQTNKIYLSRFSDETICGVHALPYKIQGGRATDFSEFPWLAALEYQSKGSKESMGIHCGGSIINDRYIMTAAHCIIHVQLVVFRVWLGATNITSGDNCVNLTGTQKCVPSIEKYDVEKAIPHKLYDHSHGLYDIGLLRLAHRIIFASSNYIRPICLPWTYAPLPTIGSYMTVAGWGTTDDRTPSDIKLKVEVPMQKASVCNAYLELEGREFNDNQLCVGGEIGKDACAGDSGGPLMQEFKNENGIIQWYQEGIVSYGPACGSEKPTVYTRVSGYEHWLATKIHKLDVTLDIGDSCTTPDEESGTCVPINTCEVVFKAASSKKYIDRNFARDSHCGYANAQLVCCVSPGPVILPDPATKKN